ncbi:MAG: prepilin-type N-terminal cleavage/methylation domain-containing protein [Planctomycetota bacterium]
MIRATRQSGVTLLEMLIALSLLSSVMIASLAWMTSATRRVSRVSEPLAWTTAADRLLQLIADDLSTGDAPLGGTAPSKVLVPQGDLLHIRTRVRAGRRGPVQRVYSHRGQTKAVWVDEQVLPGGIRDLDVEPGRHLLLEAVDELDCELNKEETILTVILRSEAYGVRSRRYDASE